MRKLKCLICSLLMASFVCGCSCKKESVDTFADVSNPTTTLNQGKGDALTVGDVYQFIRDKQEKAVAELLLNNIIEDFIDLDNKDIKDLYVKYLNEEFKTTFVDTDAYKYNGEFSEELVVQYLQSEGYKITNDATSENSYLEKPFTWNYSDYIEKEVNNKIHMKILKVLYVLENKVDLLEKQQGRKINYYSIPVSTSDAIKIRKEVENYVEKLVENTGDIKTLKDVGDDKKQQEIQKIEDNFNKISTSSDSSFQYLNSFTTCGTVRCAVEDGKQYQIDRVKNYYTSEKIVTKEDSDILYEQARDLLFSKDIDDYLYTIGDHDYLISPIYMNDEKHNSNDIILFNNTSSSMTYYLVEVVEVINRSSLFLDKAQVAELLIPQIGDSIVLDYYFGKSEIEIHDKSINELFVSLYGDYKGE